MGYYCPTITILFYSICLLASILIIRFPSIFDLHFSFTFESSIAFARSSHISITLPTIPIFYASTIAILLQATLFSLKKYFTNFSIYVLALLAILLLFFINYLTLPKSTSFIHFI